MRQITQRWRPSLALVVGLVCIVLISVPGLAFLAMRLSSNQFVRETEQGLINQAAIYAEIYAELYVAQGVDGPGRPLPDRQQAHWAEELHPWQPELNLRQSEVLPPLPEFTGGPEPSPDDGGPPVTPLMAEALSPSAAAPEIDAQASLVPLAPSVPSRSAEAGSLAARAVEFETDPYQGVASEMLRIAQSARGTTLSGAIFLDHRGVNIRPDRPQDLSFAPEVQAALAGRVGAALRDRGESYARHPLTSISRDTWYRVFVAFPVIVQERVVGVVYLSRTPSNFAKFVVTERVGLAAMLVTVMVTAGIVAWILMRLFSRPVRALSAQSRDIALGRISEPAPLPQYGVRELADLGQSMMQMSDTLTARSRQISTYTDHVTHELKSPVTAILGAAELLGSDQITPETAESLRQNIEGQAIRMNALLEKLREMTRLRDRPTQGSGPLRKMLPVVPDLAITIAEDSEPDVPLLEEDGEILFHQLARNAVEHGATEMRITYRDGQLSVDDNGQGIPQEDLGKVATPFFTTRREDGGTGLGLAIVGTLLQNYGAELTFVSSAEGAAVRINFAMTEGEPA